MARLPLLNLHEARRGQVRAGRKLAGEFAARLRGGGLTVEETETLASMLDAVEAGADANVALHVKQRGAPSNGDRDYWIWRRVSDLRSTGLTATEAYRAVAKECAGYGENMTIRNLKKIAEKWAAASREHDESVRDD